MYMNNNYLRLKTDIYGSAIMDTITDTFYNGLIVKILLNMGIDINKINDIKFGVKYNKKIVKSVCWIGNNIDCVHWIYVDKYGIIHDSYQYNYQNKNSHQFCQSYSLDMAINYKKRKYTCDRIKNLKDIIFLWKNMLNNNIDLWTNLVDKIIYYINLNLNNPDESKYTILLN